MIPDSLEIREKVEIKNTRYYQIINKHYKFALYIPSGSDDFED